MNTTTTHYYLTSRTGSAEALGRWVRRHWAVENELHWALDVTFGEDANRTRDKNAAANLGVVRRTAVALFAQDTKKASKRNKALKAALDTTYLEKLLQGNMVV